MTFFSYLYQQLVIDFDNNRIIIIHFEERRYDYYSLVYLALGFDGTYTDESSKPSYFNEEGLIEKMQVQPCTGTVLECLDPAKEL